MVKRSVLALLIGVLSLPLGGCSLFDGGGSQSSKSSSTSSQTSSSSKEETINSFEFITDSKMGIEASGSGSTYYHLALHSGENYQIRTNVDELLGETYHFVYSSEDEDKGFTVSPTGFVSVSSDLEAWAVGSIDVDLYKKGVSKAVAHKYLIISLEVGDYADIELINEGLEYDETTSAYLLSLSSNATYYIQTSISYNASYTVSYSLKDDSYSSFLNVNDEGKITTGSPSEDKVGEILIQTLSPDRIVLDEVTLKVTVSKAEIIENELVITNQSSGDRVHNGDKISLFEGDTLSFGATYNGEAKTNIMSVSNPDVLTLDVEHNSISAKAVGSSNVTFAYEEASLSISVEVKENKIVSLSCTEEGNGFVIVNDELLFLSHLILTYENGKTSNIVDDSLVSYIIADKDETYKTVTFSYGETNPVSVSYDVRYFVADNYEMTALGYDFNDLYENSPYGQAHVLPKEGNIKMLVIPVWFSDSSDFFLETQKDQIVEDIEYSMNGDRPSTELYSLKQYYHKESHGKVTMDITVSEFYESSTSYKDYSDIIEGKTNASRQLGSNAIDWYFSTHLDESFNDYDLNGDGYLDGLIVYYGANHYGTKTETNRSVAYESTNYSDSSYRFNTMAFCPVGGLYGLGKNANPSTQKTVSDLSSSYHYAFRNSARTCIHEVGHMFGNKDLYESQLASERYKPAGSFSMQDSDYGSHDPFHLNCIGWGKPQVYDSEDYTLGEKITLSLSDFQSSGQNLILAKGWNEDNSPYDEYLLMELFTPTGLNEYDSVITFYNRLKAGIRLWHVNSTLKDYSASANSTKIENGHCYNLAYSNYEVESEYDLLHWIRNDEEEPYNTSTSLQANNKLFLEGDSFDMTSFSSQFVNGNKLDNGEKLGWAFSVDAIYKKTDGNYDAIITLERTDNVRTDFQEKVKLNRSDLSTPTGIEDYSQAIFGEEGKFEFTYRYVTPPSVYEPHYPISSNGMCLFASSDGDGGYIDVLIKNIEGKSVSISRIAFTYSMLTNARPSILVNGNAVETESFTPDNSDLYGVKAEIGATSFRIQNRYNGTINHWSVLTLFDLVIDYSIQ